MMDKLEMMLVVVANSPRTVACLILGPVFFLGIMLMGSWWETHLSLQSVPNGVADRIVAKVVHKYDKAAFVALGMFLVAAFKFYRTDKRRLLGM